MKSMIMKGRQLKCSAEKKKKVHDFLFSSCFSCFCSIFVLFLLPLLHLPLFVFLFCFLLFRCAVASLYEGLSVRMSVRPWVRPSVGPLALRKNACQAHLMSGIRPCLKPEDQVEMAVTINFSNSLSLLKKFF